MYQIQFVQENSQIIIGAYMFITILGKHKQERQEVMQICQISKQTRLAPMLLMLMIIPKAPTNLIVTSIKLPKNKIGHSDLILII